MKQEDNRKKKRSIQGMRNHVKALEKKMKKVKTKKDFNSYFSAQERQFLVSLVSPDTRLELITFSADTVWCLDTSLLLIKIFRNYENFATSKGK